MLGAASSLNVYDSSGKLVDFSKVVIELASSNGGDGSFTTLFSIDELRATEPNKAGEIAVVLQYHRTSRAGGGIFVYDLEDSTSVDDKGTVFVTPKGARWKRYLSNYADLTVGDFGAIPDGKTDCLDAVTHMWNWSQLTDKDTNSKPNQNIGIRFPAGRYFISKFDISASEVGRFRLAGSHVNFGYYPSTTLVSDGKAGEYMFLINARWMSISGLLIDGQDNTKTKGFLKNIDPGGQYVRVTSMSFSNMGGRCLDMLDTLDCKIDQWYASHCSATVIYATWSGRAEGVWDHITAVELTNFNVQHGTKANMIDLQRAGQSIIRNGWIEHCEYPGDLSNGQWIFDAFNLETNVNPLKLNSTRIVSTQLNMQAGSTMDLTPDPNPWLSQYEDGQLWLENHGMKIDGSLNYQYLTSPDFIDNRTNDEAWFHVADLEVPENTTVVNVRLLGSSQFIGMSDTQTDYTTRTPEGEAIISLQNINGTFINSWSGTGSIPLVGVNVKPLATNRVRIYVKLAKYTGFCRAWFTTTSFDRFARGVRFRLEKAYTRVTDTEVLKDLNSGTSTTLFQHWMGREQVGIGYNNNNQLLMRGQLVNTSRTGTSTNSLQVFVNGQLYAIELKPITS